MNIQETAAVLAKIKLIDNREVTELVIREWHDIIGPLPYGDAIEAVRNHRASSVERLYPAHVVAGARRAREAREREERRNRVYEPVGAITMPEDFAEMSRLAIEAARAERAAETKETR